MFKKLLTSLFGLILSLTIFGQGPSNDPNFITGTGFPFGSNRLESVQQDALGNIYVGGGLNIYNGQSISNIAKLHTDGSLDVAFQSVAPNGDLFAIEVQPNGQIIIAGNFSSVNGVTANGIARINANGSVDATFCANIGTGINIITSTIRCVAIDGSGNIYAGGDFTSFNGQPYNSIVKLQSNGTIDAGFPPLVIDNAIYAMAFNSAGNLWIGGAFANINSTPAPAISRLTPSGAIDPSLALTSGATSGKVRTLALQSNGSLIVGGSFSSFCGVSSLSNICRLNANGSFDAPFVSGTDGDVNTIVTYSDDRIYVGGEFITCNSQTRNRMARLLSNGSLDNSFIPMQGESGYVYDAIIQPDMKIVAVGKFEYYMGNLSSGILRTLGQLSIIAQSTNTTVCKNSPFTISVTPSACSEAYFSCQWYFNNTLIPGATSLAYSIASAQTTNAGVYTCSVTSSSCGGVMSAPITVVVNTPPAITTQPTGTTVCEGTTINLSVVASGSNLTYQWYRSANIISGATSSIYSIASASLINSNAYRCLVTGNCGNIYSNYASLYIKSNIVTTNTSSITFCSGGTLSGISVAAGGLNPTYQWYLDGNLIPGATTASYSKTNATSANAGVYTCQVTSACGVITSTGITAIVNQMPVVTTQPISNTSVCQNGNTFSIVATGGSLTYKWYKNGVLIAGATSASYSPPTGAASNGSYYCVVTNVCGSVTSASANYSMAPDITITLQPVSAQFCNSATGNVSVAANGPGTLTYQWYDGTTAISGATSNVYNYTNLTQTANLKCLITNGCYSYYSSVATITITYPALFIPKQQGTPYQTFTTQVTYPGNTGCEVISSLTLGDGRTLFGGRFLDVNNIAKKCIATINDSGQVDNTYFNTGGGGNDRVYDMVKQTDGKVIVCGLFIGINGNYQSGIMRLNSDGSFDAAFASNCGTGPTPNSIDALAVQDDGKILVGGEFTSFNGSSRKGIVRLNADGTVDQSFGYNGSGINAGTGNWVNKIAIQKDDKILIAGFFGSVNGASKAYLARLNPDGSLDNTYNAGGSGASAPLMGVTLQEDGKAIITGHFTAYNGVTRGRIARLNADGTLDGTFNSNPGAVNIMSRNVTIQYDGKIIFTGWSSSYNGTSRKYIMRLNPDGSVDGLFDTSTGANNYGLCSNLNPDYSIMAFGGFSNYAGAQHQCVVKLYNKMDVYPKNPTLCTGTSLTLHLPDHGQPLSQIVWRFNGNQVAIQSFTYALIAGSTTSGLYEAYLETPCGNQLLGSTTVSVVTAGAIVSSPSSTTSCAGTNISLLVGTTGSIIGYQWFKGVMPVAGATGASLILNNVQTTTAGNYRCKVFTACGIYYSSFGSVTVNTCGGPPTGRMAAAKNQEDEYTDDFELTVYPNPINGFINVDCKEQAHYKAKILTLQGKELLINEFDRSTQLELKDIPAGMYLLSVYNGDDRHLKTIRIIIE